MKRIFSVMLMVLSMTARGAAPDPEGKGELTGKPAPAFQIKGIYGEVYALERLKGTVLVIQFGTSWCGGCQSWARAVHKLIEDTAGKKVLYLEVNGGENEQAALDYLNHYRSPHMLGIDADYAMMLAYKATGWPRHVVIDREGVVRFDGFAADDTLSNVRKAINETLSGGIFRVAELGVRASARTFLSRPVVTDGSASRLTVRDKIAYPAEILAARDAPRERSPRLALDAQGRPWTVYYANPAGQNDIFVRAPEPIDRSAGFQPAPSRLEACATPLTTDPADDYAPDCAFDSSGALWVAWCSNRAGRYDIYAQKFGDALTSGPTRLSVSAEDAMRPRLAAGPRGRLAVTYYKWASMNGVSRDRNIFMRLYDPTTGWGKETEVSPPEPAVEDHTDPDVAFGADGWPLVVWSYDYHPSLFKQPLDTDQPSIFGARIGPEGAGKAELAGTVGRAMSCIDLFPAVARDGAGVLWCAWDASSMNGVRSIRLAQWTGRQFVPAGDLGSGEVASTPELGAGAGGALVAAWSERADEGWKGYFTLLENGQEGKRASVKAKDADVRFPVGAQGADGKVWATWEECNERGSKVVVREITGEME